MWILPGRGDGDGKHLPFLHSKRMLEVDELPPKYSGTVPFCISEKG